MKTMNDKLTSNIIAFAMGEENAKPMFMFQDYWNHYLALNSRVESDKNREYLKVRNDGTPISFAEKEANMNASLKKLILSRANVPYASEMPVEQWFSHPLIVHEIFAVVSALVDMILPQSIIDTIGLYTDVRTIGWGDSAAFDIEPRDLFVVSKHGRAQRSTEAHKQYKGQVTLLPEMHEITVQVSLYKVLSGTESLAAFVAKAARSIETQMTLDAYAAFAAAMANVSNTTTTGLRISGYSQANITRLCQQVTAWNGGQKAVIVGTPLALVNVLPNDANYRYTLNDDYAVLGYMKQAFGYDVMPLPQVVDVTTPFGTAISNSYLWVVSPSSQKLLKLVIEGNMISNTTQPFQYANLTQEATLMKSWAVGVATNAVAGVITL
jgi:hypothetical protein